MREELGKDYYEGMHHQGGINGAYHKGARESYMFVLWDAIAKKLEGPYWSENRRNSPIFNKGSVVAEFGCGAGQLASLIFGNCFYAYGIDIAQYGINLAKKHNPHNADKFYVGNLYDESVFRLYKYNTAIFCEVLEHLRDDLKVLSNIAPGVRVIISVPSADSHEHVRYFESEQAVRERYGKTIDITSIDILPMPINNPGGKHCWFILDGVKK